jgi:hypothetical protein
MIKIYKRIKYNINIIMQIIDSKIYIHQDKNSKLKTSLIIFINS